MDRMLAVLAALLLPLAAAAADDPETVYSKLHRATLAGNVDEVLSYATAGKRKEMASLPGKEDMVRMLAMTLPKTYSVTKKGTTPDGRKALLQLRGVHASSGPARATVELLKEQGEWKVDEWSWSGGMAAIDEPALVRVQATQPAPMKAAPQEPAKEAAKEPATAQAPSTETASAPVDAPTLRKATAESAPCVIRPVMSDDDLRRCGANPPKYDNQ